MTVRINKFIIPFPLGLFSLRCFARFMPEDIKQYSPYVRDFVKAMKQYKRQYGPWNIVEIYSPSQNVRVEIRI